MGSDSGHNVTALLLRWRDGDEQAFHEMLPLVYDELRRLARRYLQHEAPGHTLQSTALVHEAYLRMMDQNTSWQNRAHFFGIAAQMMRRVLVDHARSRSAAKRGEGARMVTLDAGIAAPEKRDVDIEALDEALTSLGKVDPRQERIIELRFFAGLSIEDTSEALQVSPATVKREFAIAKAWLYREMRA
ncbi:MAG TPA: sigma-70 family RNA polymerase sigma factor [Verrucomicrobiae bacterium]|nr:sigma-70 family RNA polymerase sigma factor [Verrucomicrobiae bacterium]